MKKLNGLVCCENQITKLEVLKDLLPTPIEELNVTGNPIITIPKDLFAPRRFYEPTDHAQVLHDYWQELEQSGSHKNNQIKVVLIGNGCVGKTSLAHYMKHQEPCQISKDERTHGVVISSFAINDTLQAQIWDFAGQELYHATHRLFLQHDAFFLLLWSEKTENTHQQNDHPVSYWLDHIEELTNESSVILVKNQIDLSNQLGADPPNIPEKWQNRLKRAAPTSAITGTGVNALIETLKEEINQRQDLWQYEIPKSWFDTAQLILELRDKKYITLDCFKELCEQQGVLHSKTLLKFLHNSGELYFQEGLFQNRIILDQSWAIDQVYRIFDPKEICKEEILDQKGIFKGRQVKDFCPKLSEAESKLILSFMETSHTLFSLDRYRYDVDFPLQKFVVPALLPEQTPPEICNWTQYQLQGEPDWWILFECQFLHRGIIERIIVETARLSPDRAWWRDGIKIIDPKSNCEILIHYQPEHGCASEQRENLIEVRLRGAEQEKQKSLGNVKEQLNRIRLRVKDHNLSYDGKTYISLQKYEEAEQQNRDKVVTTDLSNFVPITDYQSIVKALKQHSTKPLVEKETVNPSKKLKIFISYAHEDEAYKDELIKCLKILSFQHPIEWWHDRDLIAGDTLEAEIMEKLSEADLVCLLVSMDFLCSDFCMNKELPEALKKYNDNSGRVVSIIVRPTANWTCFEIGKYVALPTDGKPCEDWLSKDKFWQNVQTGLEKAIVGR